MSGAWLPEERRDHAPDFDPKAAAPLVRRGLARLDELANLGIAGLGQVLLPGHLPTLLWRIDQHGLGVGDAEVWGGSLLIGEEMVLDESPLAYAFDSSNGAERWRFQGGEEDEYLAPVALIDDVVCFDAASHVYGLDFATGRLRWYVPFDYDAGGLLGAANGLAIMTKDTGLFGLDAATGRERWRFEAPWRWPRVADGKVFVASGNRILALDAATGEGRWRVETGEVVSTLLAPGTIYVQGRGRLFALEAASGTERWSVRMEELNYRQFTFTRSGAFATTWDGTVLAFDGLSGAESWRFRIPGEKRTAEVAAVTGGTVYVLNRELDFDAAFKRLMAMPSPFSTAGQPTQTLDLHEPVETLHAVAAASGLERWRFNGCGRSRREEVVVDAGTVFVVRGDATVRALDAITGTERWQHRAALDGAWVSQIIPAGGILYVAIYSHATGAGSGRLAVLDAKTGAELWGLATVPRKVRLREDLILVDDVEGVFAVAHAPRLGGR